ncbi:MAG: hypothetical protein RBS13_07995 [Bacteroidales bacterium]|nr:hypothetical protein [Bacteroidales bacterium]
MENYTDSIESKKDNSKFINKFVLKTMSMYSPLDELLLMKKYFSNVIHNYQSFVFEYNSNRNWNSCRQFIDTVSAAMAFSVKNYLRTANFDLAISLFIEQILKLLFVNSDYVVVAIRRGRDTEGFRTKFVIEPIIKEKITKEEAIIACKFITTLLNYKTKNSLVSFTILISNHWVSDFNSINFPELYDDGLMANFFEEYASSYNELLKERKRILEQRFDLIVKYEEELSEVPEVIDKVYQNDETEERNSLLAYLSFVNEELATNTSDFFETLDIKNSNYLETDYLSKLSKEGSAPVLSELIRNAAESEDFYEFVDFLGAFSQKYYHNNSSFIESKIEIVSDHHDWKIKDLLEDEGVDSKLIEKNKEEVIETDIQEEKSYFLVENKDIDSLISYATEMLPISDEYNSLNEKLVKEILEAFLKVRKISHSYDITSRFNNKLFRIEITIEEVLKDNNIYHLILQLHEESGSLEKILFSINDSEHFEILYSRE